MNWNSTKLSFELGKSRCFQDYVFSNLVYTEKNKEIMCFPPARKTTMNTKSNYVFKCRLPPILLLPPNINSLETLFPICNKSPNISMWHQNNLFLISRMDSNNYFNHGDLRKMWVQGGFIFPLKSHTPIWWQSL